LTDFGKDVKQFDGWLVELETEAHQGIDKVDQGQGYLEQEKEQLIIKLKAVDMKMEEGQGLRKKLCEVVANCEEMKELPPATKATAFMRKNLRQEIADMKENVKKSRANCQWTLHRS